MSGFLRLNRRGQPAAMSLVTIVSLAICLIFLVSLVGLAGSIVLDKRADNNQVDELNALVHEIKLVCQGHGPRNLHFATIPGRGIVFIRDLYPDALREKIVAKTGCEQYCLCAIRKPDDEFDSMATIMTSEGEGSEELEDLIAYDADIIGCVNIQKAAPTSAGGACFRSVVLDDVLKCDNCVNIHDAEHMWKPLALEEFWALPLWWGPNERDLYISESNCAWRTKLTLKKDTPARLSITSWSFTGEVDRKRCLYYRCQGPVADDSKIHEEWCPY